MLVDRIVGHARAQPGRTAVVQDGTVIDYATFARAIAAARHLFEANALPAKGLAVVRTGLLADSWCAVLALRSLGLDTIAVPSLAMVADLRLKDVVCIVTPQIGPEREHLPTPAIAGKPVIQLPGTLWKDSAAGPLPQPHGTQRAAGGHIIFTSGTTGTSKKILIGADQDERQFVRKAQVLSWPARPVVYCGGLGPWGSTGYNYPPFVWNAGGHMVFDQSPEVWTHFAKHALSSAFVTPAQARELATAAARSQQAPTDVEIRITGGVVSLDLAESLRRTVSRNVVAHYGTSECVIVMGTPLRAPEDIHWYAPCADRSVEIVDENGRLCANGEEGELRIRLMDSDSTSYLDDPETSARFFRDDCFYPGDAAVRRADGRVRLLGRSVDVLNIGGNKVATAPIEQQLQRALGVENVCLFGRLDDAGKDELAVAYEAARDAPQPRLDGLARQFPVFNQVRFVRFDAFPRVGNLQKIDRRELRRALFGPG